MTDTPIFPDALGNYYIVRREDGSIVATPVPEQADDPNTDDEYIMEEDTAASLSVDAGTLPLDVEDGAVITLTVSTWTMNGEAYVPTVEIYWTKDGEVEQEGGTTYDTTGDEGSVISVYFDALNGETGDKTRVHLHNVGPILGVGDPEPGDAPDAPDDADWSFLDGYYEPLDSDTWRPEIDFDPGETVVDAQWTTSGATPALPQHWETLEHVSGTTYIPVMLNDSETDYGLFTEGQQRRDQFRIRYRNVANGEWSDESNAKTVPVPPPYQVPGVPSGFAVSPGDNDGQIIVAMDEPDDWGDGTEGTFEWYNPIDGWQEFTPPSQLYTLDASLHGKNIAIKGRAVNGEDISGNEASETLRIPGEYTGGTSRDDLWKVFPLSSTTAYNNQSQYRYGLGGFQLQFMHCGDRSPVNPDKACFGQDVSALWVTRNARDDFPYYYMPRHNGVGSRYSASVKFDANIEDRIVFLGCNGGNGIFVSDDLGETFRKVKDLPAVPGGSNAAFGGMYRANRHLLCYDPDDTDIWYCVIPKDIVTGVNGNAKAGAIWKSTDNAETWTKVSTDPETKNVGMVWKAEVQPGTGDLILCSETNLWKSTDGGSTISAMSATGLPSGHVTWFDINPNNGNDIHACVYEKGAYRSTNGGSNFSAHKTGAYCQIYISPANRNHQWLIGINKLQPTQDNGTKSVYTSNGGNNWTTFTSETDTYGWPQGAGFSNLNAVGDSKKDASVNREEMQNVLLPDPTNAAKCLYSAKARFYSGNGSHFVCASDGCEQAGAGHANAHGNLVWDPRNKNNVVMGVYDYGAHLSTTGMKSWKRLGHPSPSHTNGAYALSFSPDNSNHIVATAGLYSGEATVVLTKNAGGSWSRPATIENDKDTGESTPKPHHTFASFALVQGSGNYIYTDHHISSDTGATYDMWTSVGSGFPSGYDAKVAGLSYQDSRVLYAVNDGQTACFRTNNRGGNWSQYCSFGKSLKSLRQPVTFTVDPDDHDVVYWWVKGTGLRRYDGSSTTTLATNVKNASVAVVRFAPNDTDVMYLLTSATGGPQVYRSVDRGVTFTDISTNLPQLASNKGLEVSPDGIVFVLGTNGTRYIGPPNPSPEAQAILDEWDEIFPQQFFGPWADGTTNAPEITNGGTTVGGTAIGNVLSVTGFSFTGTGTPSYQWLRNGEPINGATSATYTAAQAGFTRRETTVTNESGSDTAQSTGITIEDTETTTIEAPPASALSAANSKALITYTTDAVRNANTQGTGRIGPSSVVMAYAAFLGTTTYDSKLLTHVRDLIKSGYEPPCNAAYVTQHECNATGLFALVRLTDRLWDSLNATEKGKVTTIMRASAAVCAWLLSKQGAAVTTQLDGASINRANKNANHVCPKGATMMICAAFFGQSTLHDWLRNYDHDDFRTELQGYNFTNILTWFKANPNGTTGATFETKVRGGTLGNATGWRAWYGSDTSVSDPVDIMWREMFQKMCSKKVVRGIGSGQNGINVGGTMYGTMISNRTGLPGFGNDGGFEEFDSFDANGSRSDIGYVLGGYSPLCIALFCCIAAGQWDTNDSRVSQIMTAFKTGHDDLAYKIRKAGYRDYSRGDGRMVWTASNNMDSGTASQHGMAYRLWMGDALLRYHGMEPNL